MNKFRSVCNNLANKLTCLYSTEMKRKFSTSHVANGRRWNFQQTKKPGLTKMVQNKKPRSLLQWSLPRTISKQIFYRVNLSYYEPVAYIAKRLGSDPKQVSFEYLKHPQRHYIDLKNVKETLNQLLHNGFKRKCIKETVSICFYPWSTVERALKIVSDNEHEQKAFGLNNGFTFNYTQTFARGTHLRNKRLQLCLYYIEQPFDFNGYGIFTNND